jgi:hypothetical protein
VAFGWRAVPIVVGHVCWMSRQACRDSKAYVSGGGQHGAMFSDLAWAASHVLPKHASFCSSVNMMSPWPTPLTADVFLPL